MPLTVAHAIENYRGAFYGRNSHVVQNREEDTLIVAHAIKSLLFTMDSRNSFKKEKYFGFGLLESF